ncbi:MAG: AraC family transcriptional regulator [Sphingosinicella sp.]|nr:AraC family transcriptional regulator [Sphingosinicella sp.]
MSICRRPRAELRPFVSLLWATDGGPTPAAGACHELVLPSGAMHLSIRLGDSPVRLFKGSDQRATDLGTAVIGGVRESAFRKEVAGQRGSVGAMLWPGVAELLSNTPAGALAHRHTRLDDIWDHSWLAEVKERLEATSTSENRMLVLEEVLARRLPRVRGVDALIAHMLARLDQGSRVSDIVRESGFSHRYLARTFTQAVGIPPKSYQRLRRFNRALDHLHRSATMSLAEVAAAHRYADQAHMSREFLRFTGLTPGNYRRIAPADARHVVIPNDVVGGQLCSIRDGTRRADRPGNNQENSLVRP